MPKTKRKYHSMLVLLLLSGFAAAIGGWFVADRAGNIVAAANSERAAAKLAHNAVELLEHGADSFRLKNVSEKDKSSLSELIKYSDAYRIVMLGPEGKIFWSSKESIIGKTEIREFFTDKVMAGQTVIKSVEKLPSEVDEFLAQHSKQREFGGQHGMMQHHQAKISQKTKRNVIEVFMPVMKHSKFVGAFKIYSDATDMYVWADMIIKPAAKITGLVIFFIFMAILGLFISINREREKREKELESAEQNARGMHEQVEKINQEMIVLNKDLAANVSLLKNTQGELVKSGKMAQLGQLTATVAHEIRNPLGAVRTSAYLVERKCEGIMTGLEKPFARIKNGITRCDDIITELLDFARSSNLNCEPIALDEWVLGVVREQALHLPEMVNFECHMELGENFTAQIDVGFMERVLINLLSNASEAMVGKNGAEEFITTDNALISVTTEQTDRGVCIVVTDNGPGISPELMEKILEPLFTTKNFGVGLGLSAVEKILIQHQGGLDIESTPGEGARFTAWFPKEQEHLEEKAA